MQLAILRQSMEKSPKADLLIAFFILICGFGLNLMLNSKIAHYLETPKNFGDYIVFTQLIFISGSLMGVGFDQVVERYVPLLVLNGKYNEIKLFRRLYFKVLWKSVLFILYTS